MLPMISPKSPPESSGRHQDFAIAPFGSPRVDAREDYCDAHSPPEALGEVEPDREHFRHRATIRAKGSLSNATALVMLIQASRSRSHYRSRSNGSVVSRNTFALDLYAEPLEHGDLLCTGLLKCRLDLGLDLIERQVHADGRYTSMR